MCPTERKLDVAAFCEFAVTGIAIDLQNPLKACGVGDRPFGLAVGRIDISDARWIGSTPWPVVGRVGPELASLGVATAGASCRAAHRSG